MADFFTRTEELERMVGNGNLRGEFAANRVYAVNQHEKGWLNFMGRYGPKAIKNQRQGGPKFVENAAKEMWPDWMDDFADAALKGILTEAMEGAMRDYDDYLKENAPIAQEDGGALRNSGTYTVYDNEVPVRRKESAVPYKD